MEYLIFKLIHIIAVVIFMGNITVGLFWVRFAVKTMNPALISYTMKGIIKADMYFTIPGVVIITASGLWAALMAHYAIFHSGWLLWPIILFIVSGLVFALRVAPLQKQIYKLTANHENASGFDWSRFNKLLSWWNFWGLIALLTPFAALVMMTLKIPQ